ncbi:MAG: family 20 glycosylhydrolase [Kiritimatiellae bacterium]|nr:family 20 glycosylhydrolase [Kiritimatiellia bacterium]
MKYIVLITCFVSLNVAFAKPHWKYKWPTVIPSVADRAEFDPEKKVVIDASLKVFVECAEHPSAADWVKVKISAWFGGQKPSIVVTPYTDVLMPAGEEAYVLSAKDGHLTLRARTLNGIRFAMMTLRQLAQPARNQFKTSVYEIPEFTVRDRPQTPFRAMHICAFPEISLSRIEHTIRLAAYYKFNYVILESWGVFRSKKHPWYGLKDGKLTVAECRRLATIAKDLGVEIIPFFNVFGHACATRAWSGKNVVLDSRPEYQSLFEPLYGFNWCLSNPNARRVICDIVGELHKAFGRPKHFHIGCDEADPPTCAECCGGDYGKLVADHVLAIQEYVRKLGARPMMWHDLLIKRGDPRWRGFEVNGTDATVRLLDVMKKDVIICDWYYNAPPKNGIYPTMDYFRSLGYTVMTCPWDNLAGIDAQCGYARKHGLGIVGTTWNHLMQRQVYEFIPYQASGAWGSQCIPALPRGYSLRVTYGTHWRQVGWETPGNDVYAETGFFTDQIGTSIGER